MKKQVKTDLPLYFFCVTILVTLISHSLNAQIIPTIPKPATLNSNANIGMPVRQTITSPFSVNGSSVNSQNQQIIEEVRLHAQQQTALYEMDIATLGEIILPDFLQEPQADCYTKAFTELLRMLQGASSPNLKRAIFATENAYFGNKLNYSQFNEKIQDAKRLCLLKIQQDKLDSKNEMVKKMMIFHYLSDTLRVRDYLIEKNITHYPVKYDFEDYEGRENFTKQFVSKLLYQNSGQCHSIPLYYLILAEELGIEARLALSPEHAFVKIKDDKGRWNNLELTCGAIFSDYHYMGSGFIKAEALRNKIYLEPLSQTETIVQIMCDLAQGYIRKYGYDNFVKQCVDTALVYYPNCLSAHMIKANYHTSTALFVIERYGFPPVEQLPNYPQAYHLYIEMQESYQKLTNLGYEPISSEQYQQWLQDMEKEKLKPEYKQSLFSLEQIIR